MRIASQVFSVILHPLMMPTLGTLCYYFIFPSATEVGDPEMRWRVVYAMLSLTMFLPFLCVVIMRRFGKVSSMFIENQRERNWPLLLTAGIYAAGYYWVLHSRAVPAFIQLFLLGAIMTMLLAALINIKWKISLHMIGIGGFCGGFTILYFFSQEGNPLYLALAFVFAGVLGTARLLLSAHTALQILGGFLLGFAVEFSFGFLVGS